MTTIITGHFQQQATARQAIADLEVAGFASDKTVTYYVNPAGQHDLGPEQAEENESPGSAYATAGAAIGAAAGGAVGVAVGVAGLPLLGASASIATAGMGAYVGSLYGALATMRDDSQSGTGSTGDAVPGHEQPRRSGILVAVSAPAALEQSAAIRIFRALGATDIDQPQGEIVGGEWIDFNPLEPLNLVAGDT